MKIVILIIILISLIFNIFLGQFVENIDERLIKELLNPTKGGISGDNTVRLMWSYYGMMIDIKNMLKDDNKHVYQYVYNLYHNGGPQVFNTKFNYTLVQERYNWDNEALQEFHGIFYKAKKLWNNILWIMSQIKKRQK